MVGRRREFKSTSFKVRILPGPKIPAITKSTFTRLFIDHRAGRAYFQAGVAGDAGRPDDEDSRFDRYGLHRTHLNAKTTPQAAVVYAKSDSASFHPLTNRTGRIVTGPPGLENQYAGGDQSAAIFRN